MTSVTAYGQPAQPVPGQAGRSSRASTARARARSSRCSRSGCAARATWSSFSEWNSSPIVRATTTRGKQQPAAHAAHVLAHPRHRLLRPRRARHRAGAQGGRDRAAPTATSTPRSRATWRAASTARGCARSTGSRSCRRWRVYFRVPLDVALHRILSGAAQAQVVRGRHGPGPARRSVRSLPAVPVAASWSEYEQLVPRVRARRDGRDAAGRGAAARAARHRAPAPAGIAPAPQGDADAAGRRPREALRSRTDRACPGSTSGDLSGWLIVIEGTDGVGRTTHVNRLRAHLEQLGYAVAETGLTRSDLASRGIRRAKQGNTLGSNAFNLFYATDFAGPARAADRARAARGLRDAHRPLHLLADRARDRARRRSRLDQAGLLVRAASRTPCSTCASSAAHLVPRVLAHGRFDYWESGMDMPMGEDLYDSFMNYQGRIIHELDGLGREYGFTRWTRRGSGRYRRRAVRERHAPAAGRGRRRATA